MRRNQRLQNFTKPTDPLDLSNLNKSLADEYQDDQDPINPYNTPLPPSQSIEYNKNEDPLTIYNTALPESPKSRITKNKTKTKKTKPQAKIDIHKFFKDKIDQKYNCEFQVNGEFDLNNGLPGVYFKDLNEYMHFPVMKKHYESYYKAFTDNDVINNNEMTDTETTNEIKNYFEIDPSKIEFKNPNWDSFLDEAVDMTIKGLGIKTNHIEAKPYKFQFYGPGYKINQFKLDSDKFLYDQDNEENSFPFAKLIVLLPCDYTGGGLEIHHPFFDKDKNSQEYSIHKKIFQKNNSSFQPMTFISYFSNCYQELHEIYSGYRVTMTYNLCYTGEKRSKIPKAGVPINFENVCEYWYENFEEEKLPCLVHCLDHKDNIFKPIDGNGSSSGKPLKNDNLINQMINSNLFQIYVHDVQLTEHGSGCGDYDDDFNQRCDNCDNDDDIDDYDWDLDFTELEIGKLIYKTDNDGFISLPKSVSKMIEECPSKTSRSRRYKGNRGDKDGEQNKINEDFFYLHERKSYFQNRSKQSCDRYEGSYTGWFDSTMVIFFPKKAYLKLMFKDDKLKYRELVNAVTSYAKKYITDIDEFINCLTIIENKAIQRDIPRKNVISINKLANSEEDLLYLLILTYLRSESTCIEVQKQMFSAIITKTRSIPVEFLLMDLCAPHINEESILKYFTSTRLTFSFYQDLIKFDESLGLFKDMSGGKTILSIVQKYIKMYRLENE